MRRSVLSALMVFALFGAWSISFAQDAAKKPETESSEALKPVVVVSFAGMDQTMKAVKTIDKLGDGTLTAKLEAAIENLVGAREIPGLDAKRPWGIVVQTDGQQFPVVAFIPVTDLKKLLAALEPWIGKATEASKDILEIHVQNQTFYVAQRDGWAFVAMAPEYLGNMPKDPLKVLGGLHESYNLGVRALVKNVPPLFRQVLLGFIQMGLQKGMERKPDENDDQYAMRAKLSKQAMQQLATMVNELDTLVLGVKVDEKSSSAKIEFHATALPGTKTAKQLSDDGELKSQFAGFLIPDAAFALDVVSSLADTDLAQAKTALASARKNAFKELDKQELPEADKKQAKQMVGDLFDVAQKTLETGRVNVGMALLTNPEVLTFVAGASMADTAKFDSVLKRLVPHLSKEAPQLAEKIKLDAETHEGVVFHTLAIPTSSLGEAGPKLAEMVGENLDVVIGIGPQSVYLAAGRGAASTLRQVIAKSKAEAGKPTIPVRFSLAATPIAKAVAAHGRREAAREMAGKTAKVLGELPGKDHVTVNQTPIANGLKVQIVLESGVLKLIASLPALKPGE